MYKKAIYTLYTEPYGGNLTLQHRYWPHNCFMFYFLHLSLEESKNLFNRVEVITDSHGNKLLGGMGFKADVISSSLDSIMPLKSKLFAEAKIINYSKQRETFIHLDLDCMFKKEPQTQAPFFVQGIDDWNYKYKDMWATIKNSLKYIPECILNDKELVPYNMGFYGVMDLDLNKKYCEEALRFIRENDWSQFGDSFVKLGHYNMIVEQYLFGAFCRANKVTPQILAPEEINDLGYIHVWGAKRDKQFLRKLRDIMKERYPEKLQEINNFFKFDPLPYL